MTGNTSDHHVPSATITSAEGGGSQPEPAKPRPVSRLWVMIGCLALLLGLGMGFVMSSLGR